MLTHTLITQIEFPCNNTDFGQGAWIHWDNRVIGLCRREGTEIRDTLQFLATHSLTSRIFGAKQRQPGLHSVLHLRRSNLYILGKNELG